MLRDVATERARQDARWGEQNHPVGNDTRRVEAAEYFRRTCDQAAVDGTCTWALILLEEVYEAISAATETEAEEELIQVAAVAVNAVESIRRGRGLK